MKNIFNYTAVLATAALVFSSCIQETVPQGGTATSEQIGASATALQASLNGIPSQMVQGYLVYGDQTHETDMAFPATMIAMTEMLGDMYPLGGNSGYDWYRHYNHAVGTMGDNSYPSYLTWFTYYQFIKANNDVIASVDIEDESVADNIKGLAGVAYACRAFNYYMLTVLFEPVENVYTDISKVKGLTVPFVTEHTDGEASKNNPRQTHEEMIKFIYSDLDKAEACLKNYSPDSKLFPSLAVAYGIRAKVAMWDEDYAAAAEYARKAIDTFGGAPMTKNQWLDPKTGFNTATDAWMWHSHYDAENMGNLCNFLGWMSGEADWGYSSLTFPSIDRSLYNKYGENDFRRYSFYDSTTGYDYKSVRGNDYLEGHELLSLKFRCKDGDWENYATGGAIDVPIMRVEEMYLIEAEALGMSKGLDAGITALNAFVSTYRDPDYTCKAKDERTFQLSVLDQFRLEFWGEGWGFPNAKRIKPGVMQNYEGTNAPDDQFKIDCKGIKPHWNMVIPKFEYQNNRAIDGFNNPDPTGIVKGPSKVGEYAPGQYE